MKNKFKKFGLSDVSARPKTKQPKFKEIGQVQKDIKEKLESKKKKRKVTSLRTTKRKASTRSIKTKDFQRELFG